MSQSQTAPNKAISEAAARWFLRMRDAAPDAPERAQFERWLMQSPAHQSEYNSISDTMQSLQTVASLKEMDDALHQQAYIAAAKRKKTIKTVIAASIAAVFIGLSSFIIVNQYQQWQGQPVMQMAANNPIGKISTQRLTDGSEMILSANSDVEVNFYRNKRHVLLKKGEAIFEVAKDADKPFIVETNTVTITVLGTRFAVNKLSNLLRVSVDHGRVQVETKPQSGEISQSILLTNQQVAEFTSQNKLVTQDRSAEDAFSFIQGKLIFESADTQEIAETLSRYRNVPVIAEGASKRDISAVMQIKDAEQFLQNLPNIAPVSVINSQQATRLISQSKQ